MLFRSEEEYPKYADYDAINVDKLTEIPKDYDGTIGVPITFLDKYSPSQFEILDTTEPCISLKTLNKDPNFKPYKSRQVYFKNELCQKKYHRLFIRRKK